ncbi:MAG: hypothetical protein KAG66_05590 [Methylococcales bacterium]|nr:hypothetical protein [Methylococcales bacterium]
MGIYRMYTGSDNETHIEELPLSAHPELGELQTVKGLQIQQNQGGRFMDFHQAPNKRWLITLSGELEIGLGDGTVHKFGPGDVRLIEDVTGHGHTTRYVTDHVSALMLLMAVKGWAAGRRGRLPARPC